MMPDMLLAATNSIGRTAFGGIFVMLGIFVILTFLRARRETRASESWPGTIGKITRAWLEERRVNKGAVRYALNVEYAYSVYGKAFTGRQITFRGPPIYTHSAANKALAARYQMGEEVQVFYDPQNPETCVLDRKRGPLWVAPLLAVVFIIVGALIMAGNGYSQK